MNQNDDILKRIEAHARNTFKNSSLILTTSTKLEEIVGWGSLSHVLFMEAIEKEFACSFGFHEMLDFTTVGEICNAVRLKIS